MKIQVRGRVDEDLSTLTRWWGFKYADALSSSDKLLSTSPNLRVFLFKYSSLNSVQQNSYQYNLNRIVTMHLLLHDFRRIRKIEKTNY